MQSREIKELVNAEFGNMVLQTFSSKSVSVDALSSGSLLLNEALSGNPFKGYVYGRIVEIFGPEQSGKTTLALHAVSEAQKKKLNVVYVDAEHALDPKYAKSIGVDLSSLLISQPDCGEQAIEVVRSSLKHGVKLIIVDSVAALTPRAEIEGATGDAFMGKQARLMGQAMRQLVSFTAKSAAILIFINQIRMKIGVVFGNPETTTGGKALKFYASYRLEIRSPRGGAEKRSSVETDEKVEVGIVSKVKVVKNKLFPPFRRASIFVKYGVGVDKRIDLFMYLLKYSNKKGRAIVQNKSYTKSQFLSKLDNTAFKKAAIEQVKYIAQNKSSIEKEEY